jgi:hypothetical protein
MAGADPSSSLHFSSNVNPSGTMFSFSTNPGTTYQGQSLSLNGSGAFNPSTNELTLSSSGTLGGTSWTTSGSQTISAIGDSFSSTGALDLFIAQDKAFDSKSKGYQFSDGTSIGSGFKTDKNGDRIPGKDFFETDKFNKETGKWEFKEVPLSTLGLTVTSEGTSLVGGGAGTFTTSVVPEPPASLLFLGGLSLLWIALLVRKRLSYDEGSDTQMSGLI